jgi:hypothetical protein
VKVLEGEFFWGRVVFYILFLEVFVSKEKVTFYVDPKTMGYIRARAVSEKRSASLVINDILSSVAADGLTAADGFDVLLPALNAGVNQGIHKAIDGLNSRLKHLLKRAMVYGLANRLAVFQLLAAEFGVENAKRIYDEATSEAEKRLEPTLKKLNPPSEDGAANG